MMTGSRLGDLLRLAREAAGMTQIDAVVALRLAGRDQMATSTLQRWEKTGSIRLDDAILVARVYGVGLDELVGFRHDG